MRYLLVHGGRRSPPQPAPDEAAARRAYWEWANGQHRLYTDYEGKFGLGAAEHAAALRRAAEPRAGADIEQEAER